MKFTDFKIKVDMSEIVAESIEDNNESAIEFNKAQLSSGIDVNENIIKTINSKGSLPYSPNYYRYKKSKGFSGRGADLKDTGGFYRSMKLNVEKDVSIVLADFSKGNEDVRDNFSKDYDFLGLTKRNLELFTKSKVWPTLVEKLKKLVKK